VARSSVQTPEIKVRKDLIEWENGRRERTKKILEKYIENKNILLIFQTYL
jgi:hypothetical protein